MAIIKSTFDSRLSLNVQHDYITLRTPNGTFTRSFNGTKSTGELMKYHNEISNYFKNSKMNKLIDIFTSLLDPKVLAPLFPTWDKVEVFSYVVGDTVEIHPSLQGKYSKNGVIRKINKVNVELLLTDLLSNRPIRLVLPKSHIK